MTKATGAEITVVNGIGTLDRVTFLFTDADSEGFPTPQAGQYVHKLRRTDTDLEDVLSFGTIVFRDVLMPNP